MGNREYRLPSCQWPAAGDYTARPVKSKILDAASLAHVGLEPAIFEIKAGFSTKVVGVVTSASIWDFSKGFLEQAHFFELPN